MRSKRTKQFNALFEALPADVQQQTYAAYRLFKRDPYHPSLQFKRVGKDEPVYSVRIGIHYGALGLRDDPDLIVWFWIGIHAVYDKLIDRL